MVDEVYTDHSHIAGKFTILSSSKVYVGGSVNPRALLGARVHNNFVGCLRKVEFSADTLRLNLIDLARTGSKLISVVGRVDYNCPSSDPQDPVTFTTRDSHLILPPWEVSKQGVISFKFRTNEPNGLIILSTSTRPPRVSKQFSSNDNEDDDNIHSHTAAEQRENFEFSCLSFVFFVFCCPLLVFLFFNIHRPSPSFFSSLFYFFCLFM